MRRVLAFLFASVALSACGGSGGSTPVAVVPDTVVFLADGRQSGVMELWASFAKPDADTTRVISGPLVATADVDAFAWSPDRQHVAFHSDRDADGKWELYVVNLTGGAPVKVNGPLIASGDVGTFVWADDSFHLAYVADANVILKMEAFVTTISGGAVRVSPNSMHDNGIVTELAWRPGSTRLAYLADLDADADFEVTLVDANGANSVTVNGAGTQHSPRWAPSGARLAFLTNSTGNAQDRLFTITSSGAGITEVSSLATGGNPAASSVTAYAWKPDGTSLAFVADRDVNGRAELNVVAAAGGAVTNVSTVPAGADVLDFAWSPGASLLAFRRTDAVTFLPELHVVFDTGVADTILADDDGVLGVQEYGWSPDGNRIAYTADHALNNALDLFIANVLGGPIADPQLSAGLLPGQSVDTFAWNPDSTRLLFIADEDTTGLEDVFFGIVDGPSPSQLSLVPDDAHEAIQVGWTADGQTSFWISANAAGTGRQLRQGNHGGGQTLLITDPTAAPNLATGVQSFEAR